MSMPVERPALIAIKTTPFQNGQAYLGAGWEYVLLDAED